MKSSYLDLPLMAQRLALQMQEANNKVLETLKTVSGTIAHIGETESQSTPTVGSPTINTPKTHSPFQGETTEYDTQFWSIVYSVVKSKCSDDTDNYDDDVTDEEFEAAAHNLFYLALYSGDINTDYFVFLNRLLTEWKRTYFIFKFAGCKTNAALFCNECLRWERLCMCFIKLGTDKVAITGVEIRWDDVPKDFFSPFWELTKKFAIITGNGKIIRQHLPNKRDASPDDTASVSKPQQAQQPAGEPQPKSKVGRPKQRQRKPFREYIIEHAKEERLIELLKDKREIDFACLITAAVHNGLMFKPKLPAITDEFGKVCNADTYGKISKYYDMKDYAQKKYKENMKAAEQAICNIKYE